MDYKGFIAQIDIEEDGRLFGKIINTHDTITFQGRTVEEFQQAFRDSVEDYLSLCRESGREVGKAFSGNLPLRTNPKLHRQIYLAAIKDQKSINAWINDALEKAAQKTLFESES